MVNVASPDESTSSTPTSVPSTRNATEPVVSGAPLPCTVAVKVTESPRSTGDPLLVSVTALGAGVTTWSTLPVPPSIVLVPENVAVMVWVPTGSWSAVRLAVPSPASGTGGP